MQLEVVTPEGQKASAEIEDATAPGLLGEFTVLPGHTPFLSALRPGVLSWKPKGQKRKVLAVDAGFVEVAGPGSFGKDRVVVLTRHAVPAEQIDVAEAQQALEEADKALREWKAPVAGQPAGRSRESLENARAWAQARLDAKRAISA
jgi:F-type H+-transporting ATPase subunit epsilon